MSTFSTDHELVQLQAKMQSVRDLLEEDVDEFVESTRKLADWKTYVRDFPLTTITVAAVAGYLMVPGSQRSASQRQPCQSRDSQSQSSSTITGTLFGLASSMLVRAAASHLGNQVGRLAQNSNPAPQPTNQPSPMDPLED